MRVKVFAASVRSTAARRRGRVATSEEQHMPGPRRLYAVLLGAALAIGSGVVAGLPAVAVPPTSTVTLVGDLQNELGCAEDWSPPCDSTKLGRVGSTDTYTGSFAVPAGTWSFKVAINNSWDVNYGANGAPNGSNLSLKLLSPMRVSFSYDDTSHLVSFAPAD